MPRYIQDRDTGKLVEVAKPRPRTPDAPAIIGDMEPFVSPIDKREITGRRALRRHQEEHDVALHGEFGENNGRDYFARKQRERIDKAQSRTPEDREDRRRAIARAIDQQRRR
jgi:hypothetical protein